MFKKTRTIIFLALLSALSAAAIFGPSFFIHSPVTDNNFSFKPQPALASYQYTPTGGQLVVGSTVATSQTNTGSWKGTAGSDNNYWTVARTSAAGLNLQLSFDNVELYNANKIIVTLEDSNITTARAFTHQICDWVSTTSVDNAADAYCTGGGWRTLNPQKATYTDTADSVKAYSVYDGYFSTRVTSPGTVISTPLTNFINGANKRILIRTLSTITGGTVQYRIDRAQVEVAIDPVYEPGAITISAGTTVNYISDIVGATANTNINGSDATLLRINQPAANSAADFYYTFKNVRTYTGMNTIVVSPQICVNNTQLTFSMYARNFTTGTWTQVVTGITGSTCATTTEYAYSLNSTNISGFNLSDYISGSNEVWIRFLTSAPNNVRNIQFDRLYMMLGSVNTDTAQCEISWGTGTAANCLNTRSVLEAKTATPTTTTWTAVAALKYPSNTYPYDSDEDGTANEYATAQNLSFPVTLGSNMAVTAVHYAVKYRSNSANQTMDLQLKDYSGINSTLGGWVNTPGTDTNAATTYSWYDSWVLPEYQTTSPEDMVDQVNNTMNLRARTSLGNTTNPGTRNWDFAMMSIRWVEEPARRTLQRAVLPSGATLVTGSQATTSFTNNGSWRALLANDSKNWVTARVNPNGLNEQIYFDNIKLYGSNKLSITFKDNNVAGSDAYIHQICDFVSPRGVDNVVDTYCTGGGWRTLTPRKQTFTNTTSTLRKYDIYDGYFSDRSTSPGTPYVTPLTNFADSTGRFLVRTYSSVASTNQYALDFVSLEFGTDEIYEPADLIRTQTGTTTNYLSDLVGATYANLNASDDNKITIPQSGSANPADFYFTFKNVKAYTGANSLLISPEMCVSSSALIVTPYLYNFTTSTWTAITSAITPTTCATDTEYAWAVNSTTVSGFALSNYISSNREMRLRFLTNTPVAVYNLQLDRLYLMLGSINNDAAQCEVSWGTGTAGNCINTRDTMESKIATSTSSTWQTTATLEYPSSYYALDNDNDATNNEYAAAQNLSFPISLSSNTDISATHYAVKFRSNSVNQTMQLQVRDYSGLVGTSGWNNTLANETNANTIYSWADTWVNEEYRKDIDKIWQSSTSTMNMRMRTSAGNTTNPGTRDWDFALMSMRYLDANNQAPTVALVSLNSGNNITLTPNTTTPITITAVVADEQGYGDISSVQAKIFRSGLVNSYNCTNNDNNCYSIACSLSSCVSNSCLATCTVDFQFFAEPTDNGAYAISQNWNNQTWVARVEATDASGQKGASDNAYEESVEVNTLLAIDVNNLNYGSADPDTVSSEQTSTMITTGNVPVDVNLSGTDLVSGTNYIPVAQQKYNLTSSFNWGTQGTALSSTPTLLNLPSSKPTTTPSDASVNTYWRLRTPLFQKAGVYNGTNTVTAVEG